jgi:amidase
MARCPADLAALLDTMAGPDPRVPHARPHVPVLPVIDACPAAPRLGWLGDWGGALPMEEGVLSCCEEALGQMARMGWTVDDLPAPFPAGDLWTAWVRLRSYVKAMNKRPDYEDPARRALLGPAMLWEIEQGLSVTPAEFWEASLIRSGWYRRCMTLFESRDVLVLPSAQIWPFDVDLDYPKAIAGKPMDTYHRWMEVVIPASLPGLPVVNVPCGFGPGGLPMGLQLIGAPGCDALLLQIAQRWHSETAWPQSRPPQLT